MAIDVRCPSGHRLSVEDRHAGKRIRCPKCKRAVAVPLPDSATGIESTIRPSPPPLPPRRKAVVAETLAAETSTATVDPAEEGAAIDASDAVQIPLGEPPRLGYQVEPRQANTVYAISAGLVLLAVVQLVPAIKRGELLSAPAWAQCVMLLVAIQLVYAAWLALAPDWCTLWVAMLAFAGVAAFYGAALAIAVMTPRDATLVLGMDDIRDAARLWCSTVILMTTLMTFICGRTSYRWYKNYPRAH